MNSYFSTFITGFDKVVSDELIKRLQNVEITLLTDGLIVYKTASSVREIKKLKFLNNSFILLKKFDNVSEHSVNSIFKTLIQDQNLVNLVRLASPKNQLKFRIRATIKNQFIAVDRNLLTSLENKITRSVRNLRVDRSLPDVEFLVSIRSEGFGLKGIQFTSRPNYEKTLEKGELYPELASILCLISRPDKSDIFFDPFAGHGSIPAQRLNFPYKQIIAGEIDRGMQRRLEKKFGNRITVEPANALSLSMFADNSIDKIVTDPPWGFYESIKDVSKFYSLMLKEFCRVLKNNGIVVILTAQKELFEKLIVNFNGHLKLEGEYNTLVSGKKSVVYRIRKAGRRSQISSSLSLRARPSELNDMSMAERLLAMTRVAMGAEHKLGSS